MNQSKSHIGLFRLICAILITVALLIPMISYAAGPVYGAPYYWRKTIYVYTGPSITGVTKYTNANNNAISRWNTALANDAQSGYKMVKTSDEATGKSRGIYTRGKAYGSNNWAGRTTHNPGATTLTSVDIQINFTYCASYSQADVNHVANHEYGHALGLAHYDSGARVMHTTSYANENPTAADRTALATIY